MLKFRANTKSKEILLPMGITLNGEIFDTCVVEAMDGESEESISERRIQNNGGKIVTRLLATKIKKVGDKEFPNGVGEKIARQMFTDDRDTCIVEIRGLMKDEMPIEPQCPKCGEIENDVILMSDVMKDVTKWGDNKKYHKDELPLGEIEFILPDGIIMEDTDNKTEVVCKKGKLRMPDGVVEEGIAGSNINNNGGKANSLLLASCIIEIENIRKVDANVVKYMSRLDREYLSDLIDNAKPGPKMVRERVCSNCGHVHKFMLQLPYFFTSGTGQM